MRLLAVVFASFALFLVGGTGQSDAKPRPTRPAANKFFEFAKPARKAPSRSASYALFNHEDDDDDDGGPPPPPPPPAPPVSIRVIAALGGTSFDVGGFRLS